MRLSAGVGSMGPKRAIRVPSSGLYVAIAVQDDCPARPSYLDRRLLQQATVAEPLREAFRPTGDGAGLGVVAVAETMRGVGEDVKLGGDFRGLVFQVQVGQTFGDVGAVIVTGREEHRRHARFNLEAAGTAGIDEGLEIGPIAVPLDGIGRVLGAGIVLHGRVRSQFAARGKTKDADAVRLEVPFPGLTADEADGPACVGHSVILNGVGAAFLTSETIFEHEGSDAAIAKPLRQRIALMAQTELGVTTAWTDDDGRAGGFVGVGKVRGERGVVNVADIGADDFLGFGRASFGTWGAFGQSGRASGRFFGSWANVGAAMKRTPIPTMVARMATP